jgi:hypothetical protein
MKLNDMDKKILMFLLFALFVILGFLYFRNREKDEEICEEYFHKINNDLTKFKMDIITLTYSSTDLQNKKYPQNLADFLEIFESSSENYIINCIKQKMKKQNIDYKEFSIKDENLCRAIFNLNKNPKLWNILIECNFLEFSGYLFSLITWLKSPNSEKTPSSLHTFVSCIKDINWNVPETWKNCYETNSNVLECIKVKTK